MNVSATAGRRVVSIQLLRGMAALLVIGTHGANITHALRPASDFMPRAEIGAIGVDIFFVISGFIMAMTSQGKLGAAESLRFLKDRILRVAPIYYIASVPFILWGIRVFGFDVGRLVTSLLFWPAGFNGMNEPYLAVGWTLCFEMMFYAAVALAILGNRRVAVPALLAVFAVALVERNSGLTFFVFTGNPIVFEFLAGCLIGTAWRRVPNGFAAAACTIAVLCWWFVPWGPDTTDLIGLSNNTLDGSYSWTRLLLYGTPAAALVATSLCFEKMISRSLALRRLSYLGDASYSLYLGHPLAFVLLEKAWRFAPGVPASAVFLASVVLAVVAGVLMFEMVERPLTRSLKRPRKRPEPALGAEQAVRRY